MYVSFKRMPKYKQITFEELWTCSDEDLELEKPDEAATITYRMDHASKRLLSTIDVNALIQMLEQFNERNANLMSKDRRELFSTFYVEKSDKGMRYMFREVFKSQNEYVPCNSKKVCAEIANAIRPVLIQHREIDHDAIYEAARDKVYAIMGDNGFYSIKFDFDSAMSSAFRKISAPDTELMVALDELKRIFEYDFCQNLADHVGAALPERRMYHTSAYAYIKHRCTVDALKRHQLNESKWFGKFDLSNFFGSTTLEYVMSMFSKVFPFSEIIQAGGNLALERALSLAFLNGGLPQGTPISPLITNIMMIPVDFELSKVFRSFNDQRYVYTRYADDFLISSRYHFDPVKVEKKIIDVLNYFDAPFSIKSEKTRYGSSAGRNWNLGLMLNKDNKITVGHEKKRRFRAELSSYVMDKLHGNPWSLSEVQAMEGTRSYYAMVEREAIDNIIQRINAKFKVDVMAMIKADLRS